MILHQIWVGPPRPAHLDRMAETWRTQHPDWDYLLWGEAAIDALDLDNRDLYDRAEHLVPADAVGQYRADIARYEILHRYGGVYADLDTTCQKPITPLLGDTSKLVAGWEVQGKWVGNTVIAAPAGHPALEQIIAALPGLARRHAPTRPNRLSGPKAISPLLRRRRDVTLLDQGTFYPVAWDEPERSTDPHPHAYVVHHWQHQRDLRGLPHP